MSTFILNHTCMSSHHGTLKKSTVVTLAEQLPAKKRIYDDNRCSQCLKRFGETCKNKGCGKAICLNCDGFCIWC